VSDKQASEGSCEMRDVSLGCGTTDGGRVEEASVGGEVP
jgi:hypothetical protein